MPGTLYVVATPIGNLEDLTFRALRILGEVDLVAAEDTRRTSKLLAHYQVPKPLTSYREHNEARQTPLLLARLVAGESIALVSDAGTPGISDPGTRLVGAALAEGLRVVPIPGPSAVTAALSVSGLSADQFVFMGFPPATGSARRAWFEKLEGEMRTVVLFESPHRIARTLGELSDRLNRQIMVCRELTKIHETLVVHTKFPKPYREPAKGEFVIAVGPANDSGGKQTDSGQIIRMFNALDLAPDVSSDEALTLTAAATRCDVRLVRNTIKKHRILVKQQNKPLP